MIPTIPFNILVLVTFIELSFRINDLVLIIPIAWNIIVTINNKIRRIVLVCRNLSVSRLTIG